MKPSLFLFFLYALIFSSCTRNLVPAWFDTKHNPNRYIRMEADGIRLIVENLEANDQHLVFDVEIRNRTSYPVHVLPERMYCYGSEVPFPVDMQRGRRGEYEKGLLKKYAMEEREVGLVLEEKIKKQNRTGFALGLLSAGLIIFDAAMDAKSLNDGELTSKEANNAMIRDVVTMTGLAAVDVAQQATFRTAQVKEEDLYYLPDEILQPVMLPPGESCRGKVFFQQSDGRYFKLIIPVGQTEYAFDFRLDRQ